MSKEETRKLILQYFLDRQQIIDLDKVSEIKLLLKLQVVLPDQNDQTKIVINPTSTLLQKEILDYCKTKISYKEPQTIEDVSEIVNSFIQALRGELHLNHYFRPVLDGFYGFLLTKLKDNQVDVFSYAYEKIESDTVDRLTDEFDQGFIFHLLTADYSIEEIYKFGQVCALSKNHYIFRNLLPEIVKYSDSLAYDLYKYGNENDDLEQCEFQLNLIPKIFESYPNELFKKIYVIIDKNLQNGVRLLAFSKLSNAQIDLALKTAQEHIEDQSIGQHLNNLFYFTVINNNSSSEQRLEAYKLWGELMKISEDKLCASILSSVGFIDNEEEEPLRFELLLHYLNRTNDFNGINNFFYQFKNPAYLFKLISDLYQSRPPNERKLNIARLFSNPLNHFFRTAPGETEKWILEFFDPTYRLNTLPIDIMMLPTEVFHVDLLKIQDERIEFGAIKKFFYIPNDFEKLLPTLVALRKSAYPTVVQSLQYHLAELTYESYGNSMLEWLKPIIGKEKGAKAFLKPIKDAAEIREFEMNEKFAIKDLNPGYHERDLLELYTAVAHESQTKAMRAARNNPGFLSSHFKNTVIVRGNSAKMGGCDRDVTPLGTVSVGMTLDSRMYKNPDLYEFNLKNVE